ncbi:vacuolar protein-sorting-associated protein 36 [Ischnura elegans]|uniref:vacuolar protein-sorting-associated protein 36 n=1 Tax=Ischnura elegans TaxID=197161 RepID=UPI001ED8794A|nr:vacuolar protein-sorting-associated protein 36 [Ischnura elegans]
MDRFEYGEVVFSPEESVIVRENGAKIYDGDNKTSFEGGILELTSHRIIWSRPPNTRLLLALTYVIFVEEERSGFGFSKSTKYILHLSEPLPGKPPGPVNRSVFNHIKIAFKEKIDSDFIALLRETLETRKWEVKPVAAVQNSAKVQPIKIRTGIVGIERQIHEKHKETDESISKAFQDLSKLMVMAKDMVNISRNISQKIREKQGDISEDETVKFKSYLLSLGIDDPVTRTSFKNDSQFHRELAKQIAEMLVGPVTEVGGMMGLVDAYCRVNRARGLELIPPEDLLNACNQLERLHLPIILRQFDSGVKVLQLQSHSDEKIVEKTLSMLEARNSLTPEELAQEIGISVLLAKERLIITEKHGKACRDDTIEGLRFYPNLFLSDSR